MRLNTHKKLYTVISHLHTMQMRETFGVSCRTYGTLITGCVKQEDWNSLGQVLTCVEEDNLKLSKKELFLLQDVVAQAQPRSLSHKRTVNRGNSPCCASLATALDVRSLLQLPWIHYEDLSAFRQQLNPLYIFECVIFLRAVAATVSRITPIYFNVVFVLMPYFAELSNRLQF